MSRVAIVHPAATFETHPTLRNAALLLARAGHRVDVFIRRHPTLVPPQFEEDEIRVRFSPDSVLRLREMSLPSRGLRLAARVGAAVIESVWLTKVLLRQRPRLVIGVDPDGIVVAAAAGTLLRVPVAYFSLEILLGGEVSSLRLRLLKLLERRASRRAAFVLVQDEERAEILRRENGLSESRFLLVPNAPLAATVGAGSRYWHERFGLPDDEKIVLYAGSYAAWTGLAEIIESTHTWPPGWSLVVHLRKKPPTPELERLQSRASDRVLFSTEAVPQDALDELFAGAEVGIAFYVVQPDLWYAQENLRTVGLSSGKIAYYLRAGLPVIVNEGTSLAEFVREEECGVVVEQPEETGDALARIAAAYESYSVESRRAFRERLDFARGFDEVVRFVDQLAPRSA